MGKSLRLENHIEGTSKFLYFGTLYLGLIYQEVDGFYVYDPIKDGGVWNEHALRGIADILEGLNKDWNDKINEYFENEKNKRPDLSLGEPDFKLNETTPLEGS